MLLSTEIQIQYTVNYFVVVEPMPTFHKVRQRILIYWMRLFKKRYLFIAFH